MKKKKQKKVVINNYAAKHAQISGSGTHEDQEGETSKRCRQKRKWKKEAAESQLSF